MTVVLPKGDETVNRRFGMTDAMRARSRSTLPVSGTRDRLASVELKSAAGLPVDAMPGLATVISI
jgi:hypothetical protein